eukprot:m.32764 g.32764  ORF g.32764 m.32764 type:complete len:110 (-) comp9419_c0_seq4:81-410(-)
MHRGKTIALFLWKNALFQKRRKWMTIAQVFSPIFFFSILALLRVSVPREDGEEQSFCSQPISSEDFFRPLLDSYASWGWSSIYLVFIMMMLKMHFAGPNSLLCRGETPK